MSEIIGDIGTCFSCGLVYLLASLLVFAGAVIISRTGDKETSNWIIMDKGEK